MTNSKRAAIDPQDRAQKFASETPKQQAQHREIARRYRRRKRRSPKANVRVRELERIAADRYGAGAVLPNDEFGFDFMFIVANHLAHLDAADRRISAWVQRWAPWHGDYRTAALIQTVVPKPLKWRADTLAHRLGLTYATRTRLGIPTIGAIDCGKARRATLRRKRAAAREKARRAKAGAAPHATSAACLKPWKAQGISESTYYRRKRKTDSDDSNSCAAYALHIVVDTKRCHTAPPPSRGGSWARAVADTERVFPNAAREAISITIASSM